MPTLVVMPQMGESIAEGTIVRWIKQVGDSVDRDEPLFEISTDKVDAEIPSPAAGVLTEIAVREGETVPVNSVVATIGQAGDDVAPAASRQAPAHESPAAGKARAAASTQAQGDGQPASAGALTSASAGQAPPAGALASAKEGGPEATIQDLHRQKSSPLVRRIARENNIDITRIAGSGINGRVTKHDILEYLDRHGEAGPAPGPAEGRPVAAAAAKAAPTTGTGAAGPAAGVGASRTGERAEIQPLPAMRKKIAEHMILSRRTSAHVHSVFHVNFSTVERLRHQKRDEYEKLGAKLTYMAFIAKAVIDAIRQQPLINASLDGDNIVLKKDVNLGIAVALEGGLIVPVIKNADEKNLLGLCRAITDVADRARSKRLAADEVHGGTFTITNPGQLGAQFGMPIIHQPQVAILGVGTIEKRPIVVNDAIAIRTMAYLTLGFDHRLIDGAVADQFMAMVKANLEHFEL